MACRNSKSKLEKDCTSIRELLQKLKSDIKQDDLDFKRAVNAYHQAEMLKAKSPHVEVVAFSNTRDKVEEEENQFR